MRRMVFVVPSVIILSGCYPEITVKPGVTGFDLQAAYDRCIKFDSDDFDKRLSCTAAVYGGGK